MPMNEEVRKAVERVNHCELHSFDADWQTIRAELTRLTEIAEMMQVEVGPEMFRFTSFQQWVNKAQGWFKSAGVGSSQYVCIDATGRICGMGKQFMSARDRGAFPVIVYHIDPEARRRTPEQAE